MKLYIKKLNYSRCPWRVVSDLGIELYAPEVIDHPVSGPIVTSGPVCGRTKEEVIDRVLALLATRLSQ